MPTASVTHKVHIRLDAAEEFPLLDFFHEVTIQVKTIEVLSGDSAWCSGAQYRSDGSLGTKTRNILVDLDSLPVFVLTAIIKEVLA